MITAHWSANPPVLAACALVAAVHLTGLIRGPHPSAGQVREAVVFYCGLLVVPAALVSPLGYWSGQYIWVRAVQDLLLATVAPPLIVLGAPWSPLRRGLPSATSSNPPPAPANPPPANNSSTSPARANNSDVTSTVLDEQRCHIDRVRGGAGGRVRPWWLTWPALIAVAYNLIWCAWHLPVLFDLALTSRIAYAAEVVCYLGLGIAFWLTLIGSAPLSPRLNPLRRVTLVVATVAVDTVLGMVLVFGSGLLYPAYQGRAHHVLSVVADQQVAGAVLWMGLLPTFVIAAVALFLRWLSDEETEDLSTGLERLLAPRKYTWSSGRGLK